MKQKLFWILISYVIVASPGNAKGIQAGGFISLKATIPQKAAVGVDLILEKRLKTWSWIDTPEGLHLGVDYGLEGWMYKIGGGAVQYNQSAIMVDLKFYVPHENNSVWSGVGSTLVIKNLLLDFGVLYRVSGEDESPWMMTLGTGVAW
ncbi:hypothetical protein P3T73_03460 [Kiritimatiellota bacterium B12222]|nr:hypothetical protein P3T73_03460 [Kiritimatiellota bacterium B12222]